MLRQVTVSETALAAMREHAASDLPRECCGLLAGREGAITHWVRISNSLASEREFFMDPSELIRALRSFRELGLGHLGIYHSHPSGASFPSRRDVEMAFYPSIAYFIISPASAPKRQVRAFSIVEGIAAELELRVTHARNADLQIQARGL
ncbi:MAG: Mov34/MPN/PAD-1 family protein [Terriglobia bacterium]